MWASQRAAPLKRCLNKDDYDTESIYWTLKAEEEFYTQVEGQVGALKDKIGIVGHRMDTRFEDLKDPGECVCRFEWGGWNSLLERLIGDL
ncbi:hypothetical protein FALCPG4_003920 [Fusarium falciforme]